jgi:hypothetical protein
MLTTRLHASLIRQLSNRKSAQQQPFFTFKNGSPLVKELIKGHANSEKCYDSYLKALNEAKGYFHEKQYLLAKEKADEAYSQLVEVDAVTAALGKDFGETSALLDKIEEEISKLDRASPYTK